MSKSVVIVGGGVIGLCTAYYAARRGHRVTVVERDNTRRNGCSYGNAGMIVPSHFVPLAAPGMMALGLKWMWHPESPFRIKPRLDPALMAWCWRFMRCATQSHVERSAPLLRDLSFASRGLFEELAEKSENAFGLVRKGLLMLCHTPEALSHEIQNAETAHKLGVAAEILDAAQTAHLEPNIKMDIAGSVHFPQDCHLTPARFMDFMQRESAKAGVRFIWETESNNWRTKGRRIAALQTGQGELEADEFVLCAGAWSPSIAKSLRLRLPVQAGKGYSLTLPQPPCLPGICSILVEARVAVTPMGGALRFGGTMEFDGLDERMDPRRVRGIIKSSLKFFPEMRAEDFANVKPWAGLRPCSPDGLPYLGRAKAWDNLSVCTAHAMMGLSLGPVSGE
ncbi:MAG TPA: FAD-dependent oxidoreductase, partial [Verrucomicrobiaceae bacterium]